VSEFSSAKAPDRIDVDPDLLTASSRACRECADWNVASAGGIDP